MATNNAINAPKPFQVPIGGTGFASTTAYAPICGGTTTTSALQAASTGLSTAGYVLTSNGSSALPSFQASGGGSGPASSSNFQVTSQNGYNNLWGAGVQATITSQWDNINWDVGSNFSGGTFTAPATGYYYFYWNILFDGFGSSHTAGGQIILNSSSQWYSSDVNYYAMGINTGAIPRYAMYNGSAVIPMTASSSVSLAVNILGSSKTVGLPPVGSGTYTTYWGGFRIA